MSPLAIAWLLVVRRGTEPRWRPDSWDMGAATVTETQLVDLDELVDAGYLTRYDVIGYLIALADG